MDIILSHQILVTGTVIVKSYQNQNSQVGCLLQQIPDFDIQTNYTRRGFDPIILEDYFDLIDIYSMNITGDMIPSKYYDSLFTVLLPPQWNFIDICPFLYSPYSFVEFTGKSFKVSRP